MQMLPSSKQRFVDVEFHSHHSPVCSGVPIVHDVDLADVFRVHTPLVRLVLVNHLNGEKIKKNLDFK